MKCPQCKAWASVKETRERTDGSMRRRYVCANEHRFTTLEKPLEPADPRPYIGRRPAVTKPGTKPGTKPTA